MLPKNVNINIYRTVILPVAGYETWDAILREVHRFEIRVLTNMFGLKKEKGAVNWMKLHHEKLCCSPQIIRMIKSRRITSAKCVPVWKRRIYIAYRLLVGKREEMVTRKT